MVLPAIFIKCDPGLTSDGNGILSDTHLIDQDFRKAWLPFFCRGSGWLPTLPVVHLLPLTVAYLCEVVQKKKPTAGSLDGGLESIEEPSHHLV